MKDLRKPGYDVSMYSDTPSTGQLSPSVAGETVTDAKMPMLPPQLTTTSGMQLQKNSKAKFSYVAHVPHLEIAYDSINIAAECMKQTNSDQDIPAIRNCIHASQWNGASGEEFSLLENGDVYKIEEIVVEILPLGAQNSENRDLRMLEPVPSF